MIKRLPAFANETEEANWWYDNREKHAEEFVLAMKEGRVKRGGMARRLVEAEKAKNLELSLEDAMKATLIAEEKGVEVQVYLKELVHRALKQDLRSVSQEG